MSEQPARIEGITPGLTLRRLDRDQTSVADWLCACGHHQRATGAPAVTALASAVIVGVCPHTTGAAA
ncbi:MULTISPECIES: hypothetical protein [unclassified Streptomyces]|uniref:hypothetical protein n=1 Tax=unclassified Streptomyces TaxID=2593676 RepID=UPI0027E54A53|nr:MULTISPECIES: hypothetical protein [unclassified Streptomyces]